MTPMASLSGNPGETPTIHRPGGSPATSIVSRSSGGHIGKSELYGGCERLSAARILASSGRTSQHTRKSLRISNGNAFQVPALLQEGGQRVTRAGTSRQFGADYANIVGSGDPDFDDAPPGLNHLDHDI